VRPRPRHDRLRLRNPAHLGTLSVRLANGGAAQYLPQALGAAIMGMSVMTDYELSLARLIPMPAHLGVDMLGGVLLAASPWLFGFSNRVYWPHLILGISRSAPPP
jgi:hypothetical protein